MTDSIVAGDWRRIQWGRTIQLNTWRAFAAGLVWALIMLVATAGTERVSGSAEWWSLPIIFPLGYAGAADFLIVGLKAARAAGWELGQQVVGVGILAFSVAIALGDPLVFILHRQKPEWVPVVRFRPLNFVLVLFVLDPMLASRAATS